MKQIAKVLQCSECGDKSYAYSQLEIDDWTKNHESKVRVVANGRVGVRSHSVHWYRQGKHAVQDH